MATKQPTAVKSVSLEEIRKLEGTTVVGAGTASAQGDKTEGKKAKDSRKIDKTLDKRIDDNLNDNKREDNKRSRDDKADDKDIAKMNEDDLKDALGQP